MTNEVDYFSYVTDHLYLLFYGISAQYLLLLLIR